MTTVLVYDSNNLDSLLGAAAIASICPVAPVDCRSFLPEAEHYVWLGVIPTLFYFERFPLSYLKGVRNTAIANISSTKGLSGIAVPNVDYVYSVADENAPEKDREVLIVNNYGNRTLMERGLLFFGENPENFAGLLYLLREFYNPKASVELLYQVALNAKEALYCLTHNSSPFATIPYDAKSAEAAREAYDVFDLNTKEVVRNRGQSNSITTFKGQNKLVFTFYEQTGWWFIRRRFFRPDCILRNVSVTATGTIVTSSLPYLEGIRGVEPVFVF